MERSGVEAGVGWAEREVTLDNKEQNIFDNIHTEVGDIMHNLW